ncbi:hypothetical protein F4778DRAFT_770269 [Xylariomycetidae sp. FL2044]|nr:hypothetical protein F4778DRAFT_770269 [Xylariomycetidae sp. FL2044]
MLFSGFLDTLKYFWHQSTGPTPGPHSVKTTIKFYKPLEIHTFEKPYVCEFNVDQIANAKQTNVEFVNHDICVQDIRGRESEFSLERNGFEILKDESILQLEDFKSEDYIQKIYLPECKEVIRRRYSAEHLFVIGFTFRHDHRGALRKYHGAYMPVTTAHVDQTQDALFSRLRQKVGQEKATEALKNRRCLIVNLWRPLSDPVLSYPLSCCDIRTVKPEDCIPVDVVKRDSYEGESLYLRHSPGHKFYYLSRQRPDEVLLMRMAESDPAYPGKVYQGVPHAAFPLPGQVGVPPPPARESIEVRVLVIV